MKHELIPLEKAINFQIFKLALLLNRELTKALKAFGLTPERWQILATLWEADTGLSQTKLGQITLKDKPSISRLVESMTQESWLIRTQSRDDSRAYVVRPSAKANSNKEKIINSLYSHFEPFFIELGVSAQAELMLLVKRYIGIIETRTP